jgi:enamine deaminase RidA (YjgF/YER057c/UK114 family)
MPIQRVDPDGLMKPQGYTHVVVASGARTVYLAGQGAYDAQGNLVGEGDHQAQTRQAVTNLLIALKAAGATPDDLVKLTIYVVGLDAEALAAFLRGMREATEDAPLPPAASTLVGVERLAWDPMLIEIEAVAVTS